MMCFFIFIYSIMMYGLTNLLVFGNGPFDIIYKTRNFFIEKVPVIGEMLSCTMCTSTNVAWIFSLFNIICLPHLKLTPFMVYLNGDVEYWYIIFIMDSFFTSGIVWLINTLQQLCEHVISFLQKNNE